MIAISALGTKNSEKYAQPIIECVMDFHRLTWEITSIKYQDFKACWPEDKDGEARGMEGENEINMDQKIIEQKRGVRAGIR